MVSADDRSELRALSLRLQGLSRSESVALFDVFREVCWVGASLIRLKQRIRDRIDPTSIASLCSLPTALQFLVYSWLSFRETRSLLAPLSTFFRDQLQLPPHICVEPLLRLKDFAARYLSSHTVFSHDSILISESFDEQLSLYVKSLRKQDDQRCVSRVDIHYSLFEFTGLSIDEIRSNFGVVCMDQGSVYVNMYDHRDENYKIVQIGAKAPHPLMYHCDLASEETPRHLVVRPAWGMIAWLEKQRRIESRGSMRYLMLQSFDGKKIAKVQLPVGASSFVILSKTRVLVSSRQKQTLCLVEFDGSWIHHTQKILRAPIRPEVVLANEDGQTLVIGSTCPQRLDLFVCDASSLDILGKWCSLDKNCSLQDCNELAFIDDVVYARSRLAVWEMRLPGYHNLLRSNKREPKEEEGGSMGKAEVLKI